MLLTNDLEKLNGNRSSFLSSFRKKTTNSNAGTGLYRRLHLPVNALAQDMFSHDVKGLRFRCQTLKLSHPNVKFPRQSFAVTTVENVRQICENPLRRGLPQRSRRPSLRTSHLGGKTSQFNK